MHASRVREIIREEWQWNVDSGFALLREIPSSTVKRFLDYYDNLSTVGKEQLLLCSSYQGAAVLGFREESEHNREIEDDYDSHSIRMRRKFNWSYENYKSIIMRRTKLVDRGVKQAETKIPPNVWGFMMNLEIPASKDLRKIANIEFRRLIKAKSRNIGGGEYAYDGELNGRRVTIIIDYGHRFGPQIDYRFLINQNSSEINFPGYETVLGVAESQWDQIETSQMERNLMLISELCKRVCELSEVISSCR